MEVFFIGLIIALSIFVITSTIVLLRRRKRNERYPGEVIAAPVVVTSATHTAPGGYPVTQMPVGATTTAYQTQAYVTPYPPQGPSTIYVPNLYHCSEVPCNCTVVITKTGNTAS